MYILFILPNIVKRSHTVDSIWLKALLELVVCFSSFSNSGLVDDDLSDTNLIESSTYVKVGTANPGPNAA